MPSMLRPFMLVSVLAASAPLSAWAQRGGGARDIAALRNRSAGPTARADGPGVRFGSTASDNAWARRSQLGAARRTLREIRRPGRARNSRSFVRRQPLLNRLGAYLRAGVRTGAARRELRGFVREQQARLGPLSSVRPTEVAHHGAFLTEKALTLAAYRRTPAQVRDGFVTARGRVGGVPIAERRIFVQRWRPVQEPPDGEGELVPHARPTGKVVVVSPGFQETGRNFFQQIDQLTREGHEVLVMDHQWAGYSDGAAGGVDRGFGVARDVAAVAAHASEIARAEYPTHPGRQVILVGNSMGAGPGVLGALTLNDAGRIELDGPSMPRGLSAVLQAPFLRATPNVVNRTLRLASRVPGLRNVPLPSSGLPPLASDPTAQARFADHASAGDVRGRSQAFSAADSDLREIVALAESGGVGGRLYVIHADRDPLADPGASRRLVERLGGRAVLDPVRGREHVLQENPAEQGRVATGVRWLTATVR